MLNIRLIIAVCIICFLTPSPSICGGSSSQDTSNWSATIHEENSITASLLYVPYLVFGIPVRIIDGIVNPCPTTQATIPPAAHRPGHMPLR